MAAPLRKRASVSELIDALLGSFSRFNKSEKLDHLLRFLGTWSGSDKLFMLIQYTSKLLIPILHLRARLSHRAGLRKTDTSSAADGLAKLASIVGDARRLWGIWGILPIIQWLISLEKSPPPTRSLHTIERLQGWSMLAFYPLEQLGYLVSHSIIPPSLPTPRSLLNISSSGEKHERVRVNETAVGLWSTRLWALYVGLQLAHLREDRKLLKARERALQKAKSKGPPLYIEREELRKKWDAHWNEWAVNLSYLPLTVHWSLEKGMLANETWVSFFGFLAAVASFRGGWKATALPSSHTPAYEQLSEKSGSVQVTVTSPLDEPAPFATALAMQPLAADAVTSVIATSS